MLKTLVVTAILMVSGAAMGQTAAPWVKVSPDFKFQTGSELGTVTGGFMATVVMKVPQPADIVQAPQGRLVSIQADCASKSYQILGSELTDVNGMFDPSTELGAEQFARRAMPGSHAEAMFAMICSK